MSASSAYAIEVSPTKKQVNKALADGRAAARLQTPPSKLFWRFGSPDTLSPHGMLMTKLSGLAVLSAHYSFRSTMPSPEDIRRVMEDEFLQVSVVIFGLSPSFAVNSYILFKQGERLIKPAKVRADARARRSEVWPNDPSFRAKVVASFPYGTFDSMLPTTILVFPGTGGEISFDVDFSAIP
ncbi:MAG: hypothetical protein ACPGYT_06340 [Nitrospirales bacterium]